jgi:hypothetical protein
MNQFASKGKGLISSDVSGRSHGKREENWRHTEHNGQENHGKTKLKPFIGKTRNLSW